MFNDSFVQGMALLGAGIAMIAGLGPGIGQDVYKRQAVRAEKIKEYEDTVANPYVAGSLGYIDDVIVPSKTRQYIINAFDMLSGKRVSTVSKKHGNIPL